MAAERIDLREAMNVVSDVIVNRPRPLREFDQIHMKVADMLLQADHVSTWLNDLSVIFVGDGDAIGLAMLHLRARGVIDHGPARVHVLDFDERVLNSVTSFASANGLASVISTDLYNVADSLPAHLVGAFDAFYTNPPFGSANGGESVRAFVRRGIEATGPRAVGCIVVADSEELPWSEHVLLATQRLVVDQGFVTAEMIPRFHRYHLADSPEVTSCSLIVRRVVDPPARALSMPLTHEERARFYGENGPLRVHYIRAASQADGLPPVDLVVEPYGYENNEEARELWR